MTDRSVTKQNEGLCPHGYDRRVTWCVWCEDPARMTAAAPAPTGVIMTSISTAPLPLTSNVRTPREHDLKVWPEFYSKLESGEKTFELRIDDRGYRAGDILFLREWNPRMEAYTGNSMRRRVTYLMSGLGLQKDFVVMALGLTDETKAPVIVAWAVGDLLDNPAMYNIKEFDKASDAARRWNRPITGLVQAPNTPTFAPRQSPEETSREPQVGDEVTLHFTSSLVKSREGWKIDRIAREEYFFLSDGHGSQISLLRGQFSLNGKGDERG